ncbi:MAG: MarR family transcriptional regulator [Nocardia sp.]|nr:MarR family transcriptional regulator [Nocardia sp.]
MERRVFAALAAGGHAELTPAKARLVARIGPGGTRLTDLAAQAQVTKQTASSLADQLIRAGYLERAPDPTDGRARLLRLTSTGRAAADLANRTADKVQSEWIDHLGKRSVADLRKTLTALREITDPYA